jgi:hypothetical protein
MEVVWVVVAGVEIVAVVVPVEEVFCCCANE